MELWTCFRPSIHEEEEEEQIGEVESVGDEEETPVDDGQIKPFSCQLCAVSFSKFEGYREHFTSTEHRYKRRDEKKRLGVRSSHSAIFHRENCHFQEGSVVDSSSVEVFVNLLLYNKVNSFHSRNTD